MRRLLPLCVALVSCYAFAAEPAGLLQPQPAGQSGLMVWTVDSMEKIFKESVRPDKATGELVIDAARNEVTSAKSSSGARNRWKR